MKTLSDYGVVVMDLSQPLDYPVCQVIKDCQNVDEMEAVLKENKEAHPGDRIWICAGPGGTIRIGREK